MNTLSHEQAAGLRKHITSTSVFEGLQADQLTDMESMGVYMEYHQELVVAD